VSGGLDGILATRIVMDQGVEVIALHFVSPFFGYESEGEDFVRRMREKYGIRVETHDVSRKYMEMLKSPAHGYGKQFNPCVDCKILMVKEAVGMMEDYGARFIVSGEVVGQRPMSQRRDAMRIIERDSGAERILLRPLSAKLLPPTVAEEEGWVDRDALFDFSGRTRKPQMSLAERYGIIDYPTPAGGCCLTDPVIAKRIKRLYELKGNPEPADIPPLREGRPFYLGDGVILTVGRDEKENERIERIATEGDIFIRLVSIPGPLGMLRGENGAQKIALAMAIVARYSRARDEKAVDVGAGPTPHSFDRVSTVTPASDEEIANRRF
jgi:hypothetical protein